MPMKNDRMRTVIINGVPYRMRGDMKIPNWRKGAASNDPFAWGHKNFLTTPEACEKKRRDEGDDTDTIHHIKYWAGVPISEEVRDTPVERFKTALIGGVPTIIRADMHLPNWRKSHQNTKTAGKSKAARISWSEMRRMKECGTWRLP